MTASIPDEVEYLDLDPLRIRIEAHRLYSEIPEDVEDDVIRVVGLRPDDSVLDVGSGTGSFLARVRAGGHGGRLVALDASPAAVAAASAGAGAADEAVLGSATSLPFADGEFSVVTARHMLYHVDDPVAAVAEASRVLTAGGRFAATVNHHDAYPHIRAILREEVAGAGVDMPVLPSARVHSGNLPEMVAAEFGNVEVHRHDNALVYRDPEGVIRFALANLAFYGVSADTPQRPQIAASVTGAIRRRFAALTGPWREPKGYVICTAVKR
jgi:SAM-dependent methyltransferase